MESEGWTGSGRAGFEPGAALSLLSDVGPVMLHVGGAYVGQGVGIRSFPEFQRESSIFKNLSACN